MPRDRRRILLKELQSFEETREKLREKKARLRTGLTNNGDCASSEIAKIDDDLRKVDAEIAVRSRRLREIQ